MVGFCGVGSTCEVAIIGLSFVTGPYGICGPICVGFLLRNAESNVNVKSPVATRSHEKRLTVFCRLVGDGFGPCVGVGEGVGVIVVVPLLATVKKAVWFSAAGISVPLYVPLYTA